MKINWKVRFKNPVFVTSLFGFIVSAVYQVLAMLDVAPSVTEDSIIKTIAAIVNILTLMGVLVDPTTGGVSDSERAMGYDEPN